MKNFEELMRERYTTKKYDASKRLSSEQVDSLKEILRLSPSSINSQPWKFTFVSDSPLKEKLAAASFFNEGSILKCSQVVVFSVMDDIALLEKHVFEALPEGAQGYYEGFIKNQPKEEIVSWMTHQLYLASGVLLSACATMGIDSTPMEGIEVDKYKALLKQDGYSPRFVITIGYRDLEDGNHPSRTPKQRKAAEDVVLSVSS